MRLRYTAGKFCGALQKGVFDVLVGEVVIQSVTERRCGCSVLQGGGVAVQSNFNVGGTKQSHKRTTDRQADRGGV